MSRYGWKPYVPVAERRERALKKMQKLRKKGQDIQPVEISGMKIARTFWGKAWCDHIESFSDYENRLPRGRTYVRNGSVCHLDISKGEVNAMVSGTSMYTVKITIATLPERKWKAVKDRCAGQIGSLLELLQGKLSENVMEVVTDQQEGLFPLSKEIKLKCSCPDWANMCKHVAAVLYGVGARLDEKPELLFLLRGVDHEELIDAQAAIAASGAGKQSGRRRIADDSLKDVFGIEISENAAPAKPKTPLKRKSPVSKARGNSKNPRTTEAKTEAETGKVTPFPANSTARSSKAAKGKSQSLVKKPSGNVVDLLKRQRAAKKAAIQTAPDNHTVQKAVPDSGLVTGKMVTALRKKFGLTQGQFASLLGVSGASVSNWEKKRGELNFQARTAESWNKIKGLTKGQAQRKLNDL
ncbi:MAG: helix-turn-helix domain-containing protein [Desulfatibacillum sp.]|nr:helix-turn-helix domain-containing protein [Desulfatibacillum sp.]